MIALRKRHAGRADRAKVRLIRSEEAERVSETGAVGSVQEAEVTMASELVAEIWKPEYLERLARSYWRWLSGVTLGLIRVVYTSESRSAVLLSRHLPLLRFHSPDYETESGQGCVTWRIERGLLVAREGRDQGFLRITVRRPGDGEPSSAEETLRVVFEVRNFYPWLRGSGRFARFGAWLYGQTQLRIHELVCYGFLRSLGRLDLPRSRVGALAGEITPEQQPASADSV